MSLSRIAKYSAIGVGCIVFGEIYYECVKLLREKLQLYEKMEEINEIFCTRKAIDLNSKLIRRIKFRREPTLHITEVLENLILSAQKTIHVAMYIFTSKILADALKCAKKKDVKIYVIVDHTMEAASGSQTQNLKESGINVRICYDNTLHHKFCLIDVNSEKEIFLSHSVAKNNDLCRIMIPKNGISINGSLNWTREALTCNYENFSITSNSKINEYLANEFYERWDNSRNA